MSQDEERELLTRMMKQEKQLDEADDLIVKLKASERELQREKELLDEDNKRLYVERDELRERFRVEPDKYSKMMDGEAKKAKEQIDTHKESLEKSEQMRAQHEKDAEN